MRDELRFELATQTIGVEVEMNNIKREAAAKLAAGFFGTGRYSYVGGAYRAWKVWDELGRVWKFERDSSIAGPDDEKCELVTPILTYADVEKLQDLIRALRKAGAKSDATRGCGIHIHIGKEGHTPKTIHNLANIMASHEVLLRDALKLSKWRMEHYCRPVDADFLAALNNKKPQTWEKLEDVWYESQPYYGSRYEHYNPTRYHMLNLHATFTKGTIEFRLFQFDAPEGGRKNGLHAGQLKAYIQLCLALSCRAKHVRYAKYERPVALENPKYVMRFWLKTLGMVGDEFKTARDLFLRRLEGNSDCRSGNRNVPAALLAA